MIHHLGRDRAIGAGRILAIAATLCSAFCLGCTGQKTTAVWGAVTIDGAPVEQGEISFTPLEGTSGPTTGGAITAGAYNVPADKGPLVGGTYRVQINGYQKTGRKIELTPGAFVDAFDNVVPARYNSMSTLQVTISSTTADNHFDFALTRK
jgi:hypothetical protein